MEQTVTETTATFDPLAWLGQPAGSDATSPQPTAAPSRRPTACQPLSHAEELAKATATVRELVNRGANIADDYRDYVRLGFALANGLGSDGRDLYHILCARSTKYRTADCERKWRECLRQADGRTSIATFYKMAQMAGVDLRAVCRKMKK